MTATTVNTTGQADIVWYCRLCGEDLGDEAIVASGDCVDCGRIMCEGCFDYDNYTYEVRCPKGRCKEDRHG